MRKEKCWVFDFTLFGDEGILINERTTADLWDAIIDFVEKKNLWILGCSKPFEDKKEKEMGKTKPTGKKFKYVTLYHWGCDCGGGDKKGFEDSARCRKSMERHLRRGYGCDVFSTNMWTSRKRVAV
jgi:hypothetical protein